MRTLLTFVLGAAVGGFAVGSVDYIAPRVMAEYYEAEYKEAMFRCDEVMRQHFIAKKAVETAPSNDAIENLDAREVGLVACQEYDRLRKVLGSYGVSEDRLALMGLEALEEKAEEVRRFVETHEIRY